MTRSIDAMAWMRRHEDTPINFMGWVGLMLILDPLTEVQRPAFVTFYTDRKRFRYVETVSPDSRKLKWPFTCFNTIQHVALEDTMTVVANIGVKVIKTMVDADRSSLPEEAVRLHRMWEVICEGMRARVGAPEAGAVLDRDDDGDLLAESLVPPDGAHNIVCGV